MKTLIIIHGRSPLRHQLTQQFETLIQEGKIDGQIHITDRQKSAETIASKTDADWVISCGGDGTNNEVLNGLMSIPKTRRPIFSFIPAGSGNDYARLFPERDIESLLDRLQETKKQRLDVFSIRIDDKERYALNLSTMGIGAEIAQTVNRLKFKIPPALNYYSAIISWLARFRPPVVHVNSDTFEHEGSIFLAAVGKGKYAGNGLGLCPQGHPYNGHLAITLIGNVGVIDFLRYQGQLKRCKIVEDGRLTYQIAGSIDVVVKTGTLAIETDGEFLTRLYPGMRCRVRIMPKEIRFV